jgi:hypothetical protein
VSYDLGVRRVYGVSLSGDVWRGHARGFAERLRPACVADQRVIRGVVGPVLTLLALDVV